MVADEDTPHRQVHALGGITADERLGRIEELLKTIVQQLATGETVLATLAMRLRAVEIIVYGACGLGLCALVGAVLMLVVKKGSP